MPATQAGHDKSWAVRNARATNKYRIFVKFMWAYCIHSKDLETNITDVVIENGRKGYEGEPRNVLVFGLCETRAAQAQGKLGCAQCTSYK